jgi:hypothetical protein
MPTGSFSQRSTSRLSRKAPAEIDLADHAERPLMQRGVDAAEQDERDRGEDGETHGADGLRHLEHALAQPAKQGGGGKQHAQQAKHRHRPSLSRFRGAGGERKLLAMFVLRCTFSVKASWIKVKTFRMEACLSPPTPP